MFFSNPAAQAQPVQDHEATVEHVTNFLRQIEGLSALSGGDLESLLYTYRFELLSPTKNGGLGSSVKAKLPLYSAVPSQKQLHDALTDGSIPHGTQCVAHVLYPKSVPWPLQDFELKADDDAAADSELLEEDPSADADKPCSATLRFEKVPSSSSASTGELRKQTKDHDRSSAPNLSSPSATAGRMEREVSLAPAQDTNQATASDNEPLECGMVPTRTDRSIVRETVFHRGEVQVMVRGQLVQQTVRGKMVLEQWTDSLAEIDKVEEDKYKAARAKRLQLERAVRLEQFTEQKIIDRIDGLEDLKAAELERQRLAKKREDKRKARAEELRQQLKEDTERRIQEEKAKKIVDAEAAAKKAEAERKQQAYYSKQKELLIERSAREALPWAGEAQARERRLKIEAFEEKEAREMQKEKLQKRTLVQREVDDRIVVARGAEEERPPRPPPKPKAHDLPLPALVNEDGSVPQGIVRSSGSQSARGAGANKWSREARQISGDYGLSDAERLDVERGPGKVRGAGRMANYISNTKANVAKSELPIERPRSEQR